MRLTPLIKNGLALSILRQVAEALDPTPALSMSPCGKYRALIVFERRRSGRVSTLHSCLAMNAILKLLKSRNPIPPMDFAVQSLFHDTHAIFLSAPPPHQNRLITDSNSFNKPVGNAKQLIIYEGIACNTAFIITSFPA
ncbi:hypothetical protein ACP275_03G022900 [Erythranthe tilingii]